MIKGLMISIQPQHAVNILNGKKTLELRSWIPKGYVGWVYVYVTKGKRLSVVHDDENGKTYYYLNSNWGRSLNQDIPFRFWFDAYIAYKYYGDNTYFAKRPQDFGYFAEEVLKRLCLSRDEFKTYGKGKDLYAWHITKLEIFDKPKELRNFYKVVKMPNDYDILDTILIGEHYESIRLKRLDKAPQKCVWVYTNE